jgi:Flp pilus assembly protein TadG
MKNPLRRKSRAGAIMIMVTLALVMVFAFLILGIDLPMLLLAKGQLQNAADASALAGALAFAQSEGNQTVAKAAAIEVAALNQAVQDVQRPVIITNDDISFPNGNSVKVVTHRTSDTNDPLVLHFLRIVNPISDNLAQVRATATARAYPLSGTNCLKPWAYPDSFYDVNENGCFDNDIDRYDSTTSYQVPRDLGREIQLKMVNPSGNLWREGWCYAVDFAPINNHNGDPVITGGDAYRQWIGECEPYMVNIGDSLQIEPGAMMGPTMQGISALINMDPDARWDSNTGTVINSRFPVSPRCIFVANFDPRLGVIENGGRGFVVISKITVMFLEQVEGHDNIIGRFMRQATDGELCPDCPDGGFLFTIALIE